jgi:hypothetical protein
MYTQIFNCLHIYSVDCNINASDNTQKEYGMCMKYLKSKAIQFST